MSWTAEQFRQHRARSGFSSPQLGHRIMRRSVRAAITSAPERCLATATHGSPAKFTSGGREPRLWLLNLPNSRYADAKARTMALPHQIPATRESRRLDRIRRNFVLTPREFGTLAQSRDGKEEARLRAGLLGARCGG